MKNFHIVGLKEYLDSPSTLYHIVSRAAILAHGIQKDTLLNYQEIHSALVAILQEYAKNPPEIDIKANKWIGIDVPYPLTDVLVTTNGIEDAWLTFALYRTEDDSDTLEFVIEIRIGVSKPVQGANKANG